MESCFLFLFLFFTKKGNEGNFWGDGNILYLDLGGRYTLYTYVKIHIFVPSFTFWAISSPHSGKKWSFPLETIKQKISGFRGTKHIWERDVMPKIGGLNKPMHGKCCFTHSEFFPLLGSLN